MTSVLPIDSVRESQLFVRLQVLPDSAVPALVGNLPDLCQEASDRMKAVPVFHPQFTLHDATHLLRVTELMGKVLGATLETLNAVEIALLILAAHFHDQGMVPDAKELQAVQGTDDFKLHRDTWAVEHPNLREIEHQLANRNLVDEERRRLALLLAELEVARLGDYLRQTHGRRSARLVRQRFGSDQRLKVAGVFLADPLARLCESHVLPAYALTPKLLPHDELIGTSPVNLRYLALVLRLADILDFDRDRTPDGLFRTLHFTSKVSLEEWEKHRAVQGWVIRPELVRFEMRFESPVYERTARQFLDWIDVELSAANEIVHSFPQEFVRYKLDLPLKVDRSRIGPKGDAYVYHDLEFSLSRDEIVKLLMTDKLYGEPSLCVRELLQNALDALRYRKALFANAGLEWAAGRVDMEHGVDEHGHEFLRCTDNGVGMDEGVITRFLTRAGRSYYRSPEFEQERIRFRAAGVDFDPCSQFGIGFMSCFMLGDRIRIETRRDYGPGRSHGVPWVVEINGLGGMLTLKKGQGDQEVGTTVVITSRPKPAFLDTVEDQIHLIGVLHHYALAVEFPVHAQCTIPGIEGEFDLAAGIRPVLTELESLGISSVKRFEHDLSEFDPDFYGLICQSFLIDKIGNPVIANKEAHWEFGDSCKLVRSDARPIQRKELTYGRICLDGILIEAGPVMFPAGNFSPPRFLLNIRGAHKPTISPARKKPPGHPADWKLIYRKLTLAEGRLWAQFSEQFPELPAETLWLLSFIHSSSLQSLPSRFFWERPLIPMRNGAGSLTWRRTCDLGAVRFERPLNESRYDLCLYTADDGSSIGFPDNLAPLTRQVSFIVLCLATAGIEDGKLRLKFLEPEKSNAVPVDQVLNDSSFILPFSDELARALGLFCPAADIFNKNHPIVKVAESSSFQARLGEPERFAQELVEPSTWFTQGNPRGMCDSKPVRPSSKLKRVSKLFSTIDWPNQPRELQPPYYFWGEREGWEEITDADFRRWAEAEVEDR